VVRTAFARPALPCPAPPCTRLVRPEMAVGLCSGGLVVWLVVARMLGHASAAMTLDVYADLFDSDLDTVADRLDTLHREAAW
jgi:hypothetical protein